MIIGINGYAGSGKDTIGKMIQELTHAAPEGHTKELFYTWDIKKWAGKLKEIASILTGIPAQQFEDQSFKDTILGSEWSYTVSVFIEQGVYANELRQMTVREFLQKLGTEGLRRGLHSNVWVNALMADYKGQDVFRSINPAEPWLFPNWVITDTRFRNEAAAIKERDGYVIRVNRKNIKPVNNHPSEIDLDDYEFDYVINNDSDDLNELRHSVESMLTHLNISHGK